MDDAMARRKAAEEERRRSGRSVHDVAAERRPGERETGDPFTATSEGGTTAGPGFGSTVTPPGEGGAAIGGGELTGSEEPDGEDEASQEDTDVGQGRTG